MDDAQLFNKYNEFGAYHWDELKPSVFGAFNLFLKARYDVAKSYVPRATPGQKALDLGCGDGVMVAHLAEKGYSVYGLDGMEVAIELANRCLTNINVAANLKSGNVLDTGYDDNEFDLLLSLDVIEHLDDMDRYMTEIVRITKPMARILIGTPIRITEMPIDPYHKHEFFPHEFITFLTKYLIVDRVVKTHPVEWFSFSNRRDNIFGRELMLGRVLLNSYYMLTKRNVFLSEDSFMPSYQLSVCFRKS